MKMRKITMILTAVTMMSFAGGCGNATASNIVNTSNEAAEAYSIDYSVSENIDLYDMYDEVMNEIRGTTSVVPEDLSKDDFYAYYSYNGNDTEHTEYLIINDGTSIKGYKNYSLGGDDETVSGVLSGEDSFIKKMSSLPHVVLDNNNEIDGENECFGYLIFKQDGKKVLYKTQNIFEKEG